MTHATLRPVQFIPVRFASQIGITTAKQSVNPTLQGHHALRENRTRGIKALLEAALKTVFDAWLKPWPAGFGEY